MTSKRKKIVVGTDEAGRGPLAGPVIACAITGRHLSIDGLKDSKKLSAKKREEIYKILKAHPNVEWGIGRVSEKVIDRINILQATKLAMKRAVKNLEKKLPYNYIHGYNSTVRRFLLLDGNFKIDLDIPQKSIVKGDEKVFLIKLSSIIAKVTRDRMMLNYHKRYSEYGFDKHKGYGTKLHMEMLKKYGPCKIHRKTFGPIRRYCKV